jgi:hypothetical protein
MFFTVEIFVGDILKLDAFTKNLAINIIILKVEIDN